MWIRRLFVALAFAALVFSSRSARAQDQTGPNAPEPADAPITSAADPQTPQPITSAQVEELRRRLDILADELEKLRSAEPEPIAMSDARRRALGLAPSAAAAFRNARTGISLAGYGEMLLENFASENQAGAGNPPVTRLDFLRAVLYAGYRFTDRFLFNSEIEVEHGNEIFVEFAYVDYLVNEHLSLRGGLLLAPLGLVNEFHEPNVYIGARRPETEQRILPTTWRENGFGLLGSFGPISFRAYVLNGLNASGFTSAGLRGGRQRGVQARAANMAFAGRIEVTPAPGIFGGIGFYRGGSGQDSIVVSGERLKIQNTIIEGHAQAQWRGVDLRGLYARADVDDAGRLSTALNLAAGAPVAERMQGGYIQGGYNVFSQTTSGIAVTPYVRIERVDTQDRVPVGFTRDASRDGRFKTFGVELKPIPNVVLKTEYQWISNEANTGRNQFNMNLGYAF
jgi:hypothetical protein